MTISQKITLCMSLTLISLSCISEPNKSNISITPVVKDELGQRIEDYVSSIADFGFSGTVLVANQDNIIFHKSYGLANRNKRIPNSIYTVFDLASLSKQFTAAAVLSLEVQGKLSTADSIYKYFNDVPDSYHNITIHQLLTHTSGIQDRFWADHGDVYSRDEALLNILSAPLSTQPGTEFVYTNDGYIFLAAIVEQVSGTTFEAFVRENLWNPAGLNSAGFFGNQAWKPDIAAHAYEGYFDDQGSPVDWKQSWSEKGSSGMCMTVYDLYKWLRALEDGKILPIEFVERLFTDYGHNYGYGWEIEEDEAGKRTIWHGGTSYGATSELRWFPEDSLVIIAASNVRPDLTPIAILATRIIPRIFNNEEIPMPPTHNPSLDTIFIDACSGTYQLPDSSKLVLWQDNDKFLMGADGQQAINLLAHANPLDDSICNLGILIVEKLVKSISENRIEQVREFLAEEVPIDVWSRTLSKEWREFENVNGEFLSLRVLGTCKVRTTGNYRTMVELKFTQNSTIYEVIWADRIVIGTAWHSPLTAITTLCEVSEDQYVGYGLTLRKVLQCDFIRDSNAVISSIEIRTDDYQVTAQKVSD